MELKTAVEKIQESFNDTTTRVEQLVEQQQKEITDYGTTTKETAEALSTHTAQFRDMQEEIKSISEQLEKQQLTADRLITQPPTQQAADLGNKFVSSDQYTRMLKDGGRNSDRYEFKSFYRKALTSETASAGTLVDEFRWPGVVIAPDRQLRIRDLMSVQSIDSNAVEYVREIGYAAVKTLIATANASGTDTTLTVDNAEGFYAGQGIRVIGVATVNVTIDSINYDTNVITLTGQLGTTTSLDDKVTSRQGYDGGAVAATPEQLTKPEMDVAYELATESVKTIASWIPATRQILSDAGALRGRINDRLVFGLKFSEEEHILYGDGSSRMLQGILTDSNRQTYSWSAGTTGDTKVDAIRRAVTLAQLAYYPINGVVLHPNDWEDIELLKGNDEHYIWVTVPEGGVPRVWTIPVVVTTAINSGEFALGGWALGATLWDREMASIRVAEQHGTFFVENMVAILAEERLVQTVERPEAFVHGTFDAAPT